MKKVIVDKRLNQSFNNIDEIDWESVKERVKKDKKKEELLEAETGIESPYRIFTKKGQVEEFYKKQPFFYDRSGMFFVWDSENKKYNFCDDIDLLNGISKLGIDTISNKTKSEIMNALKQYGRKKIPEDAPSTWVQFKSRIYDYKNGQEFEASPKYFITNPIPHNLGKTEDTPTIDKLFSDWVGAEYQETLYEIVSYAVSTSQFMQRMFAFVGGGSNGKGTFIKLLKKFIGDENSCSSELKELSNNQFETASLYKKLLCVMGEISHDDLKSTNQLKKLAGEDDIRFCFKGKTPFTASSSTTCISLTNSMPRTPDKTMGFYRKWLIVDFPNQFDSIKNNLIVDIPNCEFENLSRKVLRILSELYKTQKFTNEGSFEERMIRYEERSNPIMKFVDEFCHESEDSDIVLKNFCDRFNEFAKKNHQRIMNVRQISKILREEGFELGNRKMLLKDNSVTSKRVIRNLSFNHDSRISEISEISRNSLDSYRHFNSKTDISDILDIPPLQLSLEDIKKAGYSEEESKEIVSENDDSALKIEYIKIKPPNQEDFEDGES